MTGSSGHLQRSSEYRRKPEEAGRIASQATDELERDANRVIVDGGGTWPRRRS